ncbi:MAG TPA: M28 family peptidase [Candidatus Krumholzibacteria bacterium]|nr:M28 family peptidase [Candidatus Krumholzibacteria bacterium]
MMRRRGLILLLAGFALSVSGCLRFGWDRLSTKVPSAVLATMKAEDIAKDLHALEGEGHAQRPPFGETERRTLRHLTRRFAQIGLKGAGDNGKFLEAVPAVATQVREAELQVGSIKLRQGDNLLLSARSDSTRITIPSSQLVFAGRGVVAPERRRDDYSGLVVAGRVVLLFADFAAASPDTTDWYSHWQYQVAEARRHGALGVLLMPDSTRSAQEWQLYKDRFESFALFRSEELKEHCRFQAWISAEAGTRILKEAKIEFARARWAAHTRGFRGRVLEPKVRGTVELDLRQSRSFNVVGEIPGRYDEEQSIIICAPWDGGSANAQAMAGLLALASAFSSLPQRPARSVVFVATTLSTRGQLGAEHFAHFSSRSLDRCAGALVLRGDDARESAPESARGEAVPDTPGGKAGFKVQGSESALDTLQLEGTGDNELGKFLSEAAEMDGLAVRASRDESAWFRSGAVAFARRGVPSALIGTRMSELRMALRAGYRMAQTRGGPRWDADSCFRFYPRESLVAYADSLR